MKEQILVEQGNVCYSQSENTADRITTTPKLCMHVFFFSNIMSPATLSPLFCHGKCIFSAVDVFHGHYTVMYMHRTEKCFCDISIITSHSCGLLILYFFDFKTNIKLSIYSELYLYFCLCICRVEEHQDPSIL